MLPAHAYPKLNKYPHLKGNFGTAWQNQQKEFDAIPGAVLFTTNCLMPVKKSYEDRVLTTGKCKNYRLCWCLFNKFCIIITSRSCTITTSY